MTDTATRHRELDDAVLSVLNETMDGQPVVMSAKQISTHLGRLNGTLWGPSPQAILAALKRLLNRGRAECVVDGWRAIR